MIVFFIALALVLGASVALQGSVNTAAALRLGSGSTLLLNSFFVILGSLGLFLFNGDYNRLSSSAFASMPWYLYLGGILGFTIIFLAIVLFPRLGAGATLAIAITGQLLAAVVIDHFGLFNVPVSSITLPRVLGILMLIGGAALVKLF